MGLSSVLAARIAIVFLVPFPFSPDDTEVIDRPAGHLWYLRGLDFET